MPGLNYFNVGYVVFGSHVARLNGVPLETIDVDLVPARPADNLDRLAEALNLLRPRWRVEGLPEGMKIDGGLEARHFLGDSAAVGLVTRLGPVDVVLEPRGFEDGYSALIARATMVRRGDVEIRVGALADLVRSKELLRRAKGHRAPGCAVRAVSRARRRLRTPAFRPSVAAVAFRILHGSSSQAEQGAALLTFRPGWPWQEATTKPSAGAVRR